MSARRRKKKWEIPIQDKKNGTTHIETLIFAHKQNPKDRCRSTKIDILYLSIYLSNTHKHTYPQKK